MSSRPASVVELSPELAVLYLKREAEFIKKATVALVLQDTDAFKKFGILTVPSFGDTDQLVDRSSDEQRTLANQRIQPLEWGGIFTQEACVQTRTIPLTLCAATCLELSLDLTDALEYVPGGEHGGTVQLVGTIPDTGKQAVFHGGWRGKEGYGLVDVGKFNKWEQDNCVFAFGTKNWPSFLEAFPKARALAKEVRTRVEEKLVVGVNVDLIEIHLLWGWCAHSHFKYHVDEQVPRCLTVTALLSLGASAMHVAGAAEPAPYKLGVANLFDGLIPHRSGYTERRTLKVSFFYCRRGHGNCSADALLL